MLDTNDKIQQQYIVALKEKEAIERESKVQQGKAEKTLEELQNKLIDINFDKHLLKEKDDYIDKMEKYVDDLRKDKESLESIAAKLEKENHVKEVNQQQRQNQQGGSQQRDRSVLHKKCYACGNENHLIKDCDTRRNVFVRFHGSKWLNSYELDRVFGKYGRIISKRIKKNYYGEETKMAMICYEREEEAKEAIWRMRENKDWHVQLYRDNNYTEKKTDYNIHRDKINSYAGFFNKKVPTGDTGSIVPERMADKDLMIDELKKDVLGIKSQMKGLAANLKEMMSVFRKEG